jgi:hypothetical protein
VINVSSTEFKRRSETVDLALSPSLSLSLSDEPRDMALLQSAWRSSTSSAEPRRASTPPPLLRARMSK